MFCDWKVEYYNSYTFLLFFWKEWFTFAMMTLVMENAINLCFSDAKCLMYNLKVK